MSTQVVVGPVRLSFLHCWEAKAPKGSNKLQFSTQILIDIDDKKNMDIVEQAIAEAREEGAALLKDTPFKKQRDPIHDGFEDFPGDPNYKNKKYLNAANTRQPGIVKKVNGKIVDIIEEDEAYSGMYAYVSINFFAYNNVGVGIGCSLQHIMKYKDGERMDGRVNAEKAFEGVDFGDTEEDETPKAVKESTPKKEDKTTKKTGNPFEEKSGAGTVNPFED